MLATYRDRKDSEIYGERLIIFRRNDLANDNYFFRAKIAGVGGYIRRSCKTSNAAEAMVFARAAYEDLLVRHKGGLSIVKMTVDKFFDEWIEKKKHNFTDTRISWKRSVYERYQSLYFGKREISELNKKVVDGYWDFRLSFWHTEEGKARIEINEKRANSKSKSSRNIAKKPSFATLKAEASLINEFLRAAVDDGYLMRSIKISAQDAVPKSERELGYRDTFTEHEWRVLRVNLYNFANCKGKFANDRVHQLHLFQRKMLHAFVLLKANTGLRVGEIKQLVWGDIEIKPNSAGEELLQVSVRKEISKTRRERRAIAQTKHIISVIRSFRDLCEKTAPNDLVFFNEYKGQRDAVDLSVAFKKFLERVDYEGREGGLRYSQNGKARTLYSLRHWYAISRLKQGMDIFALATTMGTGVNQIRNHYARHISGDAFEAEATKYRSAGEATKKAASVKELLGMVESGLIDEEAAMAAFKRVVRQ